MNESRKFKYLPPELAERLRSFRITVRRPVHGRQEGLHRSPNFGASVEFAEYREYSPGDPINLIDWDVYARSDRYVIRQCHEETNLRAYIMLDTSGSLSFRDIGDISKHEYSAFLAAGLMFIFVNQGDSASLLTFDDSIRKFFEPVGTFDGLTPLLGHLEAAEPGRKSDIEAAIHEAAGIIAGKSLVVVVSDLLQDSEAIVRGVRHLHHKGHNIMILHVTDMGERQLCFDGVAELRDLETGDRMVVEVDQIRNTYANAVSRHLAALKAGFSECLVDYHLIDTRSPVDQALYDLQDKGTIRNQPC